jgi:hypothetical protein
VIPDELIRLLENKNQTRYLTAKVTAVQASAGTVTLAWNGGSATSVPYLSSYAPAVNDKVHVLSNDVVGMLILGRTLATATPADETTRLAYVSANRSMSWQGNPKNPTTGKVLEGLVRQGSTVTFLYSGAYVYPSGQVTLGANEYIAKAEMMISRGPSTRESSVTPVINELVHFATTGQPIVEFPERSFMVGDMAPETLGWYPVPVDWCGRIVSSTSPSIGITFAPTSAQLTLVYAEYDAYTTVPDPASPTVQAGQLRLTIQGT